MRRGHLTTTLTLALAWAVTPGCAGPLVGAFSQETTGRMVSGTARVQERAQFVSLSLPGITLVDGQTISWNGVSLRVEQGGVWLPPGLQEAGEVAVSVPGRGAFRFDPGRLKDGQLAAIGTVGPEGGTFVRLTLRDEPLREGQRLRWGQQDLRVEGGGVWLSPLLLGQGPVQVSLDSQETFTVDPATLRGGRLALDGGLSPREGSAPGNVTLPEDPLAGSLLKLADGSVLRLSAGLEALSEAGEIEGDRVAFPSSTGGRDVSPAQLLTAPGAAQRDPVTGAFTFSIEGHPDLLGGPGARPPEGARGLLEALRQVGSAPAEPEPAPLFLDPQIVSGNGGNLVANNAAAIAGFPYFPVAPPPVKRQLLQLAPLVASLVRTSAAGVEEYLWPGLTTVRAIRSDGTALTGWVRTDGTGAFYLKFDKPIPPVFFVQAQLTPPGPLATPLSAYALAFAPKKDGPTLIVPVDANSTLTTGATLHLMTYIPPEIQRLSGLISTYESQVASLLEQDKGNPDASGTADPDASGTADNKQPKITPEEQAAIDAFRASIGLAEGRNSELQSAWNGFNPLQYAGDMRQADRVLKQTEAEANARAASLRAVYNPLYRLATAKALTPRSLRPIAPDSPDLPTVGETLQEAGVE